MVFVTQTIIGAEGGALLHQMPENVEAALELRNEVKARRVPRRMLKNAIMAVKGHLQVIPVRAQEGERGAVEKPLSS